MDRDAATGTLGDPMAEVMLRLHIEKKVFQTDHGELPILANIELTLGTREIVALVGPSGCGKTTLLKIVGGLDTDFHGTIDWSSGSVPRIGTVFQEPRLLPWRTVRQNLILAQPIANPALADELLRSLDLALFRDAFPRTLSLGMARRVAIARAFAIQPDLLLLDEPFVSLDTTTATRSRDLLVSTWRERPTAVLLITHDRAEAVSLADRIILLSDRPAHIVEEIVAPNALRAGR